MPEPSRHDEPHTEQPHAEVFARLAEVPLDDVDKLIELTEAAYTDLNEVRGHEYWGDLVLRQGAAVRALRQARESLEALRDEAVGARNTELGVLVATGVLGAERRYAASEEAKAELVDWLLATEGGAASHLFAWDRPYEDEDAAGPYRQIRAVVDAESRLGALVFTEEGEDGDLSSWHTKTHEPVAGAPTFRFDVGSALVFPNDAVLGWDLVRAGLEEFARTGVRPEAVSWQPARWDQP